LNKVVLHPRSDDMKYQRGKFLGSA
jgi:hypothetical protein